MTVRLAIAGAIVALLALVFIFNASSKMPDFEVYHRAGQRAIAAEPLYRTEDGHYQFKYLPAFAFFAIPAALVPMTVAKAVWFAASAGLIAALLALSLALLPTRHRPTWVLVGATLVAMAKFYGHELVLGQVNVLFAAVILLAVVLERRGRPAVAGLLVALAVIIKPYALILLPWLAARRARRALAVALAGVAAALFLPALRYGARETADLHVHWWRTVTESTAPNVLNPDNVSLAGMYAKWLGPGDVASQTAAVTAVALLGAAALVVARRKWVPAPIGLETALLLTLIPLLSPQGWDYVFLLSTPAVLYLVNYDRMLPAPVRLLAWTALALVAFSLYDVIGRRAYAAFMAWSAITVCYLVLVTAVVTLRLRRVA